MTLFQDFENGSITLPQWSKLAESAGLNHIDINRKCLGTMSLDEVRSQAEACTLPFLMVSTYSDFSNPEAEAREAAVKKAIEDMGYTRALGAQYIRLTAGQYYEEQTDKEAISRIYGCFEVAVKEAEKMGLKVLLENHSKPGAWRNPDFNFHQDRMLALWESLKELPIGVNYDVANAYAVGNWQLLMKTFGDRIETVHLNDLESLIPLRFCLVGKGIVNLKEQVKALKDMGFRGAFSLEEAGMEGRHGVIRAAGNVKRLLAKAGY